MIRAALLLLALALPIPASAIPVYHWPRHDRLRLYPQTYPFHAVCRNEFYIDRHGHVRCRMRIR